MRITIKCIIKWGLIAEILTAIVGQVGEFTLRYCAYSNAFDELFGHYRVNNKIAQNEEFELNPNAMVVGTNRSAAIQVDPNYQYYDHRSGRTLNLSPSTNASQSTETPEPVALKSNETEPHTLATIMNTIFRASFTEGSQNNTKSTSISDMLVLPERFDPRPLLVCSFLVFLNLLFIVSIVFENFILMCSLTIVWLLYFILVLLVLHAGSSTSATSATITTQSPWATLTPSPFTILVLSIILVFSLIMIAIIAEERRQIAYRIRAKSAAIPLVKSRDMDLDLDEA